MLLNIHTGFMQTKEGYHTMVLDKQNISQESCENIQIQIRVNKVSYHTYFNKFKGMVRRETTENYKVNVHRSRQMSCTLSMCGSYINTQTKTVQGQTRKAQQYVVLHVNVDTFFRINWARTWASKMWDLRISPTRNKRQYSPSLRQITALLEKRRVVLRFLARASFANIRPTYGQEKLVLKY